MARIELFNLKRQTELYGEEYLSAVREVMSDAEYSGGSHVKHFEREFAEYTGSGECVCLNSGTSALFLALRALGVGRGDEVILPSNTFVATAWSVVYNGAVPVFCDCMSDTWEIDVDDAKRRITDKTKAIIGVHLYGLPCEIGRLGEVASSHSLLLIEDCAQANGALFAGKHVGTLSDAGCYSFYPTKNLGAFGEGGCVITDNTELAGKVRSYRVHCDDGRGNHTETGFNMRMDGIQAAVLSQKLTRLDYENARRAEIAGIYRSELSSDRIITQKIPAERVSSNHLFVVCVPHRDKFMSYMDENGIACGIHYAMPCHRQSAFSALPKTSLPRCEYLAEHCVSVPIYPELTDFEIEKICDCAKKGAR